MRKTLCMLTSAVLLASCSGTAEQDFVLNDSEYFEKQGVNVLVYSNLFNGGFNDEKNSGIEIIHHGVRTVQGGAVRLSSTPEQWDLVPATPSRTVSKEDGSIEVAMRYDDYDFDSRVVVKAKGEAFEISVYLDEPLPEKLVGHAGFNLEFLPSQYWGKTYVVDGRPDRFPRYAASETVTKPNSEKPRQFKGYKTYDDRGTGRYIDPLPLEQGREFIIAPDAPERMMTITSDDSDIMLYDGRMLAQNGWYVFRSELPADKVGKVITWTVEPNSVKGWVREPNIGFSQVGYMPDQPKIAVIELDKNYKSEKTAQVIKVETDGNETVAYKGKVSNWGRYYKYNYDRFDFTELKEPGVYYIKYGETKTNNFIINDNVYDKITDATSDIWIPIHMNHMYVNEGYRVWHGEPFKEGYRQAPRNTDHFDLHDQGPTTDTRFKDLELIPGLNVGGYFDAGDFDIETHSNISVVQNLVRAWELFRSDRDQTFVSQEQRYVDLHRPDGTPDILQYIEHGVLNLVAQAEILGHMSQTLSNSVLDNYHHLGDAGSLTDGLPYNPALKPYEVAKDGKSSGTPDDMWAFTSRDPYRDFNAATMFAAASHALRGYNDALADRALKQSKRLLKEAAELMAKRPQNGNTSRSGAGGNISANLQLYVATGEQEYLDKFETMLWPSLDRNVNRSLQTALDAIPYLGEEYKEKLRPYVEEFKTFIEDLEKDNPYGVPIGLGNWAGGGQVLNHGTTVCYASKYYPEIIDKAHAYKVAEWFFGRHPYHNYSLVATVGAARPKEVFYGNNRADFSFIPGNVAPGVLFRHPDHFENYDDWPFLWGQNEGTIGGNTSYLIFGSAFKNLVRGE